MVSVIINTLDSIGSGVLLLLRTLRWLPRLGRQRAQFLEQCAFMGNATMPLVMVLSLFIGGVLALQIGYTARFYGVKDFIGTIVGLSVVRELAPVMTAIMVTGRIGSSVTAELASMRVYQEVDALRTMNIPPERFLVLPRLAAIFLVMPILTILAVVSGWLGGQIVANVVGWIDLTPEQYYRSLRAAIKVGDVTDGLIKAQVFGTVVLLVCCNTGLRTSGGPREIGAAVTRAVVACIIFILVLDYLVTSILL